MLSSILAVATAVAVLGLLWPLVRAGRAPARAATATDLYRAQIAEIEADAARGFMTGVEAEAARAEAARRLLASTAPEPGPDVPPARWVAWAACLGVLVFVPAFAGGLYLVLGEPGMPDAPLAARLSKPPATTDVAAALAKIEAHLKDHPDDARGWEVIAPVYRRLGRAREAALAYAAVLRLKAATPELRTRYGEALVYAASGKVTGEARTAFAQALGENPSLVEARFFVGLAAEQDGDAAKAAEIWGKIVAEEAAGSPLAAALRERIAGLGAPAGPSRRAAADIAALPHADRASAIRGMVERLASRLAENGRDLEGWLRLIRAYAVLDEREKALSALGAARRNLSDDAAAVARIDALARELGLETKGAS
jgi:cytochrome c-type biogenesis protein CcmH